MRRVKRRPAQPRSRKYARKGRTSRLGFDLDLGRRLKGAVLPLWTGTPSVAAVLATALVVAFAGLLLSPAFAIRDIEVTGNQGSPTQDILDRVAFAEGRNAFAFGTGRVVSELITLPGVTAVRAHVLLPDRLVIHISDTRPEVAWISGNNVSWVDKNGVVRDPPVDVPEKRLTVGDLTGRSYRPGDKVDGEALKAAVQLNVLLQPDILGFEYQRPGEIIVVGAQGWRGVFNSKGDLHQQVESLKRVLASGRKVVYVDVRVPKMPTYR